MSLKYFIKTGLVAVAAVTLAAQFPMARDYVLGNRKLF